MQGESLILVLDSCLPQAACGSTILALHDSKLACFSPTASILFVQLLCHLLEHHFIPLLNAFLLELVLELSRRFCPTRGGSAKQRQFCNRCFRGHVHPWRLAIFLMPSSVARTWPPPMLHVQDSSLGVTPYLIVRRLPARNLDALVARRHCSGSFTTRSAWLTTRVTAVPWPASIFQTTISHLVSDTAATQVTGCEGNRREAHRCLDSVGDFTSWSISVGCHMLRSCPSLHSTCPPKSMSEDEIH